MNRKILFVFIVGLITLVCFANVYYSLGQTKITVFVTLMDSKSCQSLTNGQDSSANWNVNTCTLIGSSRYSPIFLTTSNVQLTIDSTITLILSNGLGFANYGTIVNSGKLVIDSTLVNYGILTNENTGTITVNTLLISMNVTSQNIGDTGIVNNSGTLVISKNGFVDNGNLLVNLGTLTNAGTIYNYVSGINYSASIVNVGIIQGVAIKTSTNVASQLNTTVTAKTTIKGCASC